MSASPTVHATCFVLDGRGILLRGASGAGKSRIALHFIETASAHGRQARLVGDDRVYLEPAEDRLIASVPASIAGLIERRATGLRDAGIERIDWQPSVPVGLVVDILDDDAEIAIPSKKIRHIRLKGVDLPYLPVPRDFQQAVALIEAILPQLPPV
ncbi:HPr kinase/phosphatase C-terminal domain-containing protein [Labrys sp. LIt4]|uniref:HPr kinase/phosphorylase n=1 Tax=Labrys sp. LIt4 TaxID=2821355 RepID=UPI001ADF2CDF|nr:HPr kinase/phosphatase C-terminal domain-containing protein [Labrys sp. LIt4]MBP0582420.1 HPr kinase/phosphatase C-terminal domain-containing protein [Labrys sp. LIt4]